MRITAIIICCVVLALAAPAPGQQTSPQQPISAAAPSNAAPLSTPSITGPLQAASPIMFDAGPLGKLDLDGVVSGFGLVQTNHASSDSIGDAALSDGQVFVQKVDGTWQFYVQAGAYNILSLGTTFTSTGKQVDELFGPVPVAYLKLAPAKNTSFQIGALPTLMGAEYTFAFENMSIERGLLWNQENAINRGIQLNQTIGRLSASLSWNDGYYSNRYSWLSGALTYTRGPHSLEFVGMGNLGHTKFQTAATPIQNNSVMYMVEYTYSKGSWIVQPYYQYSDVPRDLAIRVVKSTSTEAVALLVSHTFGHGFSTAGRIETVSSSGSATDGALNLLYGPGSSAWSATVTPTFQKQRFFVRGDASVVHAISITGGDAFGKTGSDVTQTRGVLEIGLLF